MKCPKCQTENREGSRSCKKCGHDFSTQQLWKPTWKWQLKTLAIIYSVLIVLFFVLNIVLKPYMRQIPKDITPWLKEIPKKQSVG